MNAHLARLRHLVIVLAIVVIVVSSIVGVLQSWPSADLSRVWAVAGAVALYAAGLRWPPTSGGSAAPAAALIATESAVRAFGALGAGELLAYAVGA